MEKRGEGKGGQAEARKNSGGGTVEVEVDERNGVVARASDWVGKLYEI